MKRFAVLMVLFLVACIPVLTGTVFEVSEPIRLNFTSTQEISWTPDSACEKVDTLTIPFAITCDIQKVPLTLEIFTNGTLCKGEGDGFLPENLECR